MQKPTLKHKKNMRKQAFTLIELLIVIAIIGILFIVLISKVDFATDKAKASGVQTDFRSFQTALEMVSKENAGFNTFGWDTGDNAGAAPAGYTYLNADKDAGDRIRNSYDEGDKNLNGIYDKAGENGATVDEVWTGRKVYTENWTGCYTLINPGNANDMSAIFDLETAINKNLDPKLHIVIADDGTITMANGLKDPWSTQYHGQYITNASAGAAAKWNTDASMTGSAGDNMDRGAILMYSNGANQKFGTKVKIEKGVVTATVSQIDANTPDNNKMGSDDYVLAVVYTYTNGYGETGVITEGFSNNQEFLTGNGGGSNDIVNGESPNPGPIEPVEPSDPYETIEPGLYQTGTNYTVLIKSWAAMEAENIIVFNKLFDRSYELAGDLKMPDDITAISANAFTGTALTSVILPKNCVSIATSAFQNCTNLKTMIMYGNVRTCDTLAINDIDIFYFYGTLEQWCSISGHSGLLENTREFYINDELVEHIDFRQHPTITNISSYAFYGYQGLKSVIISEFLTNTNGIYCFSDCTNLQNVEIYANINGTAWFADIGTLETVYLSGSLNGAYMFRNVSINQLRMTPNCKYIGDYAFFAAGAKTVFYEGSINDYLQTTLTTNMSHPSYSYNANWYFNGEKMENVIIDGVEKINNYLFYGTNIETLSIGSSVKEIGIQAFYKCIDLASINLSEGLEVVQASAFADCDYAIINYLPNSLKTIGYNAFATGYNRTGELVIGNNVELIEGKAFYFWYVNSIKIGNGVKVIESEAFNNCTQVLTLTIGSGIENIESNAFLDLKKLKTITILAEEPPVINSDSFKNCNAITKIYVPAGSVDTYKNAEGWSAYADLIEAIS